jgi:hypothetical protein
VIVSKTQEVQSSTRTWKLIACGAVTGTNTSSTPETDDEHITMQSIAASLHKRGVANAVLLSNSSSSKCYVKAHFTKDAAKKRYTVHELGCCALFCSSVGSTTAVVAAVPASEAEQPAAATAAAVDCVELLPQLAATDSAMITKVAVTAAGALVYTVHSECGTTVSSIELLPEQ